MTCLSRNLLIGGQFLKGSDIPQQRLRGQ